jgi:hypothetical protein
MAAPGPVRIIKVKMSWQLFAKTLVLLCDSLKMLNISMIKDTLNCSV